MCTLYLSTPRHREQDGARSFEEVKRLGVGRRYAFSKGEVLKLKSGDRVVVIRKDRYKSRAEGTLIELAPTGDWTENHLQLYDVRIDNLIDVDYIDSPHLTRRGILVDC